MRPAGYSLPTPVLADFNSARVLMIPILSLIASYPRHISRPLADAPRKPATNVMAAIFICPVGWGSWMHRLYLCRGVRPPPNECPEYDTKQFNGEIPVMPELWRIRSTPLLPLLPGPLWPGVVAPDRAQSMDWIELTAYLC